MGKLRHGTKPPATWVSHVERFPALMFNGSAPIRAASAPSWGSHHHGQSLYQEQGVSGTSAAAQLLPPASPSVSRGAAPQHLLFHIHGAAAVGIQPAPAADPSLVPKSTTPLHEGLPTASLAPRPQQGSDPPSLPSPPHKMSQLGSEKSRSTKRTMRLQTRHDKFLPSSKHQTPSPYPAAAASDPTLHLPVLPPSRSPPGPPPWAAPGAPTPHFPHP